MRFQENAIFEKRPKIDRKSIRVRISGQPIDDFAFFPISEATSERFCLLRGSSGLSWATFLASRSILEAIRASPEAPLGRSRGAPGTLRDASGTPLERPGCSRSVFGRFLVPRAPPGSDFGSILGPILAPFSDCFAKRITSDFGLTFATGGRIAKTDSPAELPADLTPAVSFSYIACCPSNDFGKSVGRTQKSVESLYKILCWRGMMERTMLENHAGESRWSGLCCEDSTEEPHDCTSPNIFGMPMFRRYFTFFERLQGFQDELSLPDVRYVIFEYSRRMLDS